MGGKLIVFEGGDGAGKTTQARLLVAALTTAGQACKYIRWPDRTTETGQVINKWLTGQIELPKNATNLLFLSNLWELAGKVEEYQSQGCTVVADRFKDSNIVYSMSRGCTLEEAKKPTEGLPNPDLVFFFDIDPRVAMKRKVGPLEVLESVEVQSVVRKMYHAVRDDSWITIDADKPMEVIHEEVLKHCAKSK